jgi:MFS family permease
MDPFLEKFFPVVFRRKNSPTRNNYCKYDNQALSAFTSSLYLAGQVSTLAAAPVTRNYGRRASIICGGISFLIGAALNAGAGSLSVLIIGRIMLGVGIGFGNQVAQVFHVQIACACCC